MVGRFFGGSFSAVLELVRQVKLLTASQQRFNRYLVWVAVFIDW